MSSLVSNLTTRAALLTSRRRDDGSVELSPEQALEIVTTLLRAADHVESLERRLDPRRVVFRDRGVG